MTSTQSEAMPPKDAKNDEQEAQPSPRMDGRGRFDARDVPPMCECPYCGCRRCSRMQMRMMRRPMDRPEMPCEQEEEYGDSDSDEEKEDDKKAEGVVPPSNEAPRRNEEMCHGRCMRRFWRNHKCHWNRFMMPHRDFMNPCYRCWRCNEMQFNFPNPMQPMNRPFFNGPSEFSQPWMFQQPPMMPFHHRSPWLRMGFMPQQFGPMGYPFPPPSPQFPQYPPMWSPYCEGRFGNCF